MNYDHSLQKPIQNNSSEEKIPTEYYADILSNVISEISTIIVGQRDTITNLITTILAGGHVLLEGVPGIAKTLLISTFSQCIDCSFVRIQFTPDLLPADITGTKIYNAHNGTFQTVHGPIFHNIILADEINRSPPKVQSALLEAMQEQQVTIQGETFPIEQPFFVLATQNPLESEGTYPLPDAQMDRFMQKLIMTYPSFEQEITILERFTTKQPPSPACVLERKLLHEIQQFVRTIHVEPEILHYAASLVDATRHPATISDEISSYISYGASPRASINLILCAKARAILDRRNYVIPHDIKLVAPGILRHRLMLTYEGEAAGITTDHLIDQILKTVAVP